MEEKMAAQTLRYHMIYTKLHMPNFMDKSKVKVTQREDKK